MRRSVLFVTAFLLLPVGSANAALVISNLEVTSETLTFDVAGTIGVVGGSSTQALFFGVDDDRDWVNSFSFLTATNNGGDFEFVSGHALQTAQWGHYFFLADAHPILAGDTVNMSVLVNAQFDVTHMVGKEFVVQAGAPSTPVGDEVFDPVLIAGSATVVPVPAAVWLFASALAGLGWLRRKEAS